MLSLIVPFLLITEVKDSISSLPKAGEAVVVRAPFNGWVPALTDEESYRKFVAAVKAGNVAAVKGLRPKRLKVFSGGQKAVVSDILEMTKDRGLKAQAFPTNVHAVVLRFPDAEGMSEVPFWVPSFYCRKTEDPVHPSETKFPIFLVLPDPATVPKPGMKMMLTATGDVSIPVAKGLFDFEAMVKAMAADDDTGLKELEEKKRIAMVEKLTEILVLERHANRFLANGNHAVEARILTGPYKDQTCWVPEQFTATLEVKMLSYKNAEAILSGKEVAKKKPKRR